LTPSRKPETTQFRTIADRAAVLFSSPNTQNWLWGPRNLLLNGQRGTFPRR